MGGHHTIIARITADNPVSVRLHEGAGFAMVGTMCEVGVKFGRLLDVHIMQLVWRGLAPRPVATSCYRFLQSFSGPTTEMPVWATLCS